MTRRFGIAACLVVGSAVLLVVGLRGLRHAPPAAPTSRASDAEADRANRERLRSLGYLN